MSGAPATAASASSSALFGSAGYPPALAPPQGPFLGGAAPGAQDADHGYSNFFGQPADRAPFGGDSQASIFGQAAYGGDGYRCSRPAGSAAASTSSTPARLAGGSRLAAPQQPLSHATPSGHCPPHSFIRVEVTDPQRQREDASPISVPGIRRAYTTYLITSSALDADSHVSVSSAVRRRFSDFVLLDSMLQVDAAQATLRGHFIAPRPLKHAARAQKLKREFVERRRLTLQAYLRRLACHPCGIACLDVLFGMVIAASRAFHAFLEAHEELRVSAAWRALPQPGPTWSSGMQRLLKQMVGKEQLTPAPSDAARSTARSHDLVRKVREAVHHVRHKRDKDRLTDKEKELREAGEVLRAAAGTASTLTHTAAGLQHHSALLAVAVQRVGEAFMQMGSLEQAAMHVELVEATTRFGEGCAGIAGAARAAVESQSERIQALRFQSGAMAGMLFALRSREEALNTHQALQAHATRQRAVVENLQDQHSARSLKALQSLAAAEAAEAAAASEYHAVAARNEADMAGYIAAQASEMRESLLAVAEVELEHQAVSAEGWLDICRGLGCSSAHIAAIQEL